MATYSMQRKRASRSGQLQFRHQLRLARTADADRSATGDGFLINNYD